MIVLVDLSSVILQEALLAQLDGSGTDIRFIAPHLPHQPAPDIVLCDAARLPELAERASETAKLLLLETGQTREQTLALLLAYPIDGVIASDSDLQLLIKALRVVANGQVWVDNSLLKLLLQQAESQSAQNREQLSKKERDIVVLISQGCRNKEIASRLFISEQTVKTHLSRIFRKLNISTRTQLIPFGIKYRCQA
jgi:DNA-binding NarL/FixJ family response regulator